MRGGLESVVEELRRGASPSTGPPCVLRTHRQVSTSLRLGFSLLLTRERIKLLRPRADFNIKMEEDVSSVVDCMLTGIQYGKDARLLARVLTALDNNVIANEAVGLSSFYDFIIYRKEYTMMVGQMLSQK